jgi:hypothetical protein
MRDWLVVAVLAVMPLLLNEIVKLVKRSGRGVREQAEA